METSKRKEPSPKKKCITWKKRTKMERFLILACLLLFVAFGVMIGLVLHLETFYKKNEKDTSCESSNCEYRVYEAYKEIENDKICENSVCKFRAGTILKNMDFTADPCEDFYKFSCGSYMKYENIYNENINNMNKLDEYYIYLAKQELEKPGYSDHPSFITKIRKLYKSCLNKPDLKETVKDFLNVTRLDGWPISDDDNSSFVMEDAVALQIIYKPGGILFEFYFKENIPTFDKGWVSIEKNYLKMMKYLFTELNISENDSEKYIDEMLKLQTSLKSIKLQDENKNDTILTVSQLETICPQIKWNNMFRYLFNYLGHPREYEENLLLNVISMEFISKLCKVIEETDKRIIYNTLIWNMLYPYLTHFDHIFKQLEFPSRPFSFDKMMMWKICINEMTGFIRKGIDYMMIKTLQPERKIKEVKMYVEQISEILYEVLSNEDWIDDYSKNMMKNKLKNVTYHVGYSKIASNEEILSQFFDKINIDDSYMKNIIIIEKKMIAIKFVKEFINFKELLEKEVITDTFKFLANYKEEKIAGRIAISVGTISFPFYVYGSPQYLNYGSIGAIIGHEFTHAFDRLDLEKMSFEHFDGLIKDDDKFKIDWPEEFLNKYRTKKICFAEQRFKRPIEENFLYFIMMEIGENIADNVGLSLAYRAYEKYVKKHGKQPKLPGINFTDKQLFFISYTQGWCHFLSSVPDGVDEKTKFRAIGPLINSIEFSEAFQCPLNSTMNPEHKCKMWG